MISFILTVEVILCVAVSFAVLPTAVRRYRGLDNQRKLGVLAWSAMIIGAHQLLRHEHLVQGVGSFTSAAYYQLAWMVVAGLLLLLLVATSRISSSAWKLPLIAFAIYIFVAFASAVISKVPMMTIYRASQVAMDLALVLAIFSGMRRANDARLLIDVTFFWLIVLLFLVVLGAVLFPDRAFVESTGAIGRALRGVIPLIHQNELGLMAAVGVVLSSIRLFGERRTVAWKLFWAVVLLVSGTILILAQARTSLAGAALALILSGLLIKRMRWLSYVMVACTAMVLSYYWLSGSRLGIEDDVTAYLRRGVSDEHLKTLSGRTEIWLAGWEMFKDSPFIGHGYASGVRYEGDDYGLRIGTNMHSSHVQVLANLGAIGYIFWFIFVFGASVTVYRNHKLSILMNANNPLSVEALLIVFVIVFRSFLGHVLVTHQLNMMIFLAVYVYAALSLDLGKHIGRRGRHVQIESSGRVNV